MNDEPIKDFQAHVSKERTHLSQVRRAFTAGLEIETIDPGLLNFYVVCCDYLEYALSRLIAQDNILHDLLVPHIEPTNQEYLDKLTRLEKGLNAMEGSIEKLSAAKNNLIKNIFFVLEVCTSLKMMVQGTAFTTQSMSSETFMATPLVTFFVFFGTSKKY